MALISRMLLFFLAVLPALATSGAHGDGNLTLRCHPDQAATLLQLKESFSFGQATTSLPSWQDGSDCCGWEGVGCAGSSGHVRTLNLSGRGLYSLGLDPVIFNLTSLQVLDLSKNNFAGYNMPSAGFERLTLLTHLSIFKAGLQGWIPNGIGKLENLISLDLSNRYDNSNDEINLYGDYHFNALLVSSFQNLVENLTNLRELYLDSVDINSSGEEYCQVLAKYVPRLEVLSLEGCLLYGPLHQSLSNLSSLTVINLRGNDGISAGLFPEFFMDFVNLSVLQLAYTNLEGLFPRRIFQSEILRVLDLSGNPNLHGNLPNLSNASSLETLNLDGTNFSYAKPSSSSNFISLQELSLDGGFIIMKFLASFSMLGSLSQLLLTRLGLRDLGSLFSWIGYLKNLTSLELVRCDLLSTHPSSISNLKSLRSLTIVNCNLSISILSAIANLKDLRSLEIIYCRLNGAMPPAIGNLTNLRRLDINDCGFLGPMPSSIGNLVNLRNLYITSCIFSGPIPSTVGFLRKLERLEISGCKFSGPMPSAIAISVT